MKTEVFRNLLLAACGATCLQGCIAFVPLIEPDNTGQPAVSATNDLGTARRTHRHARRDPIPSLIRQLEQGDAAARTRAASTLGEYPTRRDETIPHLAQATQDSSKNVRRAAVKALAVLKDPRAIAPIRKCLKDPDPFVRESARNALKRLGVRA